MAGCHWPAGVQCTAGDQAVQVDMLAQVLAPGVQHRGHAQFTAQAFGVGGEGLERRPGTLEQQTIDDLVDALHPGVQRMR